MKKNKIPLLGINIDHVATLRQARGEGYPNLVVLAQEAIAGGADNITMHLREDRRHIQDRDVFDIKKTIRVPLNLEMAPTKDIVAIACNVKPFQATFVPEKRQELTTEGGLDVISNIQSITKATRQLHKQGIRIFMFIEPSIKQINATQACGADGIEIHTGHYAHTYPQSTKILSEIKKSALYAESIGLEVHAGHGLNYANIKPLLSISTISEYNIGHYLIAEALTVGLRSSVKKMKIIMKKNATGSSN